MKTLITVLIALLAIITFPSSASASWSDHSSLFAEVSIKTGVDVSELAAMAAIESSFRAKVKAKTSTATGLFQFTSRTWRVTLESYGAQYGLTETADRRDPMANALMGAEYIKENRRVLQKKLGRYPSLADVYMAHLIAPRRVAALEDINPKASIAHLYPKLAKYNRTLFYKETGKARTVSEFKKYIGSKVWRAYNTYLEPAKLAVVKWKQLRDAALYAKATGDGKDSWKCSEMESLRKWSEELKEKSLRFITTYMASMEMSIPTQRMAKAVSNDVPQPINQYDVHVLYLDRRWMA